MLDGISGDAIIFDGFAWSGRDDQVGGIERNKLIHRDLVIAEDANVRAEFAEILNQVIRK